MFVALLLYFRIYWFYPHGSGLFQCASETTATRIWVNESHDSTFVIYLSLNDTKIYKVFQSYSKLPFSTSAIITNFSLNLYSAWKTMTWKCFPHHWPFVRGIHWSPVDSPHKGPVMQNFEASFVVSRKDIDLPWSEMPWHSCDWHHYNTWWGTDQTRSLHN